MLRRLALLTLLGAVSACDAPPSGKEPLQVAAQDNEAAAGLPKQQAYELSEQCASRSRDEFRREWKDGSVSVEDAQTTADFTNHYNAKLNTCFYLLTVNHYTNKNDPGNPSVRSLSIKLFDIDEREPYGEYLEETVIGSPTDSSQTTCRVENSYCASKREWEALVEPYMED
jgi:hypothetical protein